MIDGHEFTLDQPGVAIFLCFFWEKKVLLPDNDSCSAKYWYFNVSFSSPSAQVL